MLLTHGTLPAGEAGEREGELPRIGGPPGTTLG